MAVDTCKEIDMFSVRREAVPDDALLKTYRGAVKPERWGSYADCFAVTVDHEVDLADFVSAFYTSWVFRIEGFILHALLGVSASERDARALAGGAADRFSAWYVGQRTATQLLMCDRYERTRSWLCVTPKSGGGTRLLFGSAVAAKRDRTGVPAMGGGFHLLLRFHILYSQILLHAAKRNLPAPRRTSE
jgi:hypothetical protein